MRGSFAVRGAEKIKAGGVCKKKAGEPAQIQLVAFEDLVKKKRSSHEGGIVITDNNKR